MDFDNIDKKKVIIIIILFLLLIVISIVNLLFKKDSNSLDVEGAIDSFAQLYYEKLYYPNIKSNYGDDYSNILEEKEEEGIKLNLRTIINTFEDVDAENFYSEGNYCDFVKSYALIYPKAPFSLEDYEIKVVTSCKSEL